MLSGASFSNRRHEPAKLYIWTGLDTWWKTAENIISPRLNWTRGPVHVSLLVTETDGADESQRGRGETRRRREQPNADRRHRWRNGSEVWTNNPLYSWFQKDDDVLVPGKKHWVNKVRIFRLYSVNFIVLFKCGIKMSSFRWTGVFPFSAFADQ